MIPRQWKGETAVIIASGPSLTQEDVDYCKGKAKVAVINDNYKLAPWADLLYAADYQWWHEYHDKIGDFKGQKWTQCDKAAHSFGLTHVPGTWKPGISHHPEVIHYGYNSGFQCLNLVYLMGVKRILLLGFDMQRTGGKIHWFGNHPPALHRHSDYKQWANHLDKQAKRFEKVGVEVINCSRETSLQNYQRALISDCL